MEHSLEGGCGSVLGDKKHPKYFWSEAKKLKRRKKVKKRILILGMVLALVAALAVPIVALAGNTGTTTVSGTQASVIEVTAPTTISFGAFSIGVNSGQSATNGTVACNGTTWSVTAKDLKVSDAGLMTSGANKLAGKLQISSQESSGYAAADTGITYESNPTTIPFYVKQNVAASDKAGAYTITITFTGVIDS
jgi:hypothetical protein